MNSSFFIILASATEAWQSVPLMSLHLPFMGYVINLNIWAITVILAMLLLVGNHSLNHSKAYAGNSGLAGFRKSVSGFWNTQTLERVHLKWRQESLRSVEFETNIPKEAGQRSLTNRLPVAWASLSDIQGKTTVVWLSVLFFLLLATNSFGLVPLCSAITGQAGFTLGMSIALLIRITFLGTKRQGLHFVRLFLPSGPSWPIAPLFILLESVSYRFRAISLGTRLYCNLFAGHLLLHLFTSLCLVPVFALPFVFGAPITIIVVRVLMALSGLETLVVVLQSGVFCLLASFYMNEVLRKKTPLALASTKHLLFFPGNL